MAALLTWALEVLFGWKGFVIAAALCLTVGGPPRWGSIRCSCRYGCSGAGIGHLPVPATAAVTSAIAFGTAGMVHHAVADGRLDARRRPGAVDGAATCLGSWTVWRLSVGQHRGQPWWRSWPWHWPRWPWPRRRRSPGHPSCRDRTGCPVHPDPRRLTRSRIWKPDRPHAWDLGVRRRGCRRGRGSERWADVVAVRRHTARGERGMVRNSMLISDGRCLHAGGSGGRGRSSRTGPHRRGVLAHVCGADQHAWLRSGAGVGTLRVHQSGIRGVRLETLGPSVAVFVVRPDDVPQLVAVKDLAPGPPGSWAVPCGALAAAIDGDWVYLYGTANHGDTLVLRGRRVHIDHLLDPAAMQYWDGYEWSESAGSGRGGDPRAGGPRRPSAFCIRDQGWYAVSKQDEFLGSYRVLDQWVSDRTVLRGPGSGLSRLPNSRPGIWYMVLAHPRFCRRTTAWSSPPSRNDVPPHAASSTIRASTGRGSCACGFPLRVGYRSTAQYCVSRNS